MTSIRCKAICIIIIIYNINRAIAELDVSEKPKTNARQVSERSEICPFSKIIEDIYRIRNKTTSAENQFRNSERTKIFLNSVGNITSKRNSTNKEVGLEDDLINKIIASINRIQKNFTSHRDKNDALNDAAIIKVPKKSNENANRTTYHAIDNKLIDLSKNDDDKRRGNDRKNITIGSNLNDSEQTSFVEVQTFEPNNAKNNTTPNNILDILKNLIPMFKSTLTKEIHNITIIERDRDRNNSYSETKNISTIVVTYCDNNFTKINSNDNENNTILLFKNKTEDHEDYLEEDYSLPANSDFENEDYSLSTNLTEEEKKDILEAADYGVQRMYELYSVMEPKLYSMGLWLDENEPGRYLAAFNAPAEMAARYARYGYASLQAAARLRQLARDEIPSDEDVEQRDSQFLGQFPGAGALRDSSLLAHCPLRSTPACPPASKRYRTHDGTCNNVKHPRWGSTMTPVQRFLPPSYSDDLQAPRRSIFGKPLPSPREISFVVHEDQNVESSSITHLLMQWGQFIDHDITSSSQSRGFNGSVPRCCKNGGRDFMPKEFMHPECMPIEVPPSDPFYGRRGVRCLEFIRSSPAPRDDCALGWREQLNQVSAYIDGSPLYGSSARQSDRLRLFRNGMLQYGRGAGGGGRNELCRGGALSATCFKSGDGRVNEHPGLVAAHIVWVKQHNRIAQELSRLNPHWSDEKTYQETRRIIGAMLQHITYNEFLPIVLGTEVMRLFDLDPQRKGYYRGYDGKIDPSPASSFGSAAFRFGHSLVQPSMMRYDRFHRPIDNNVSLHEEPSNPSNIWSMGAVDRLLLGMVNQPVQKRDEFITEELTNHLFQTPQFDFGMDLAAINIQRGRDHGLPPYTAWREPCGLTRIKDFEDLFRIMPARAVRKLEDLYRHVDDIDLFTGGMAERPVVGGMVGPTFSCIIAQQFSNLRKGDRFWYENGGFHSSFTPAQLQQIRRTTLAQVLCNTLDHIETVQEFAFLTPSKNNERVSCRSRPMNSFSLSPWIELDSETDFNNDIKEFKDVTKSPTVHDFVTTKPIKMDQTTKRDETSTRKPTRKKPPPALSLTIPQNVKKENKTETINRDKTDTTTQVTKTKNKHTTHIIDDKLDFRNKSRRYDDRPDRYYQTRPTDDYEYDEEPLAQQTVVVNNLPYRRPYRPVIAVTENVDKYTYLINYVPRPTQSWRQTTKKYYDRDVIKVTYQTYDDTYGRPNRPYYNKYHDRYSNNYKNRDSPDDDNVKNLNKPEDNSQKSDIFQINLKEKDNEEQNRHDDNYRNRDRPSSDYPINNRPDINYQTNIRPDSNNHFKTESDDYQTKNKLHNSHQTNNHPEKDNELKNKPDVERPDNYYQITNRPYKDFETVKKSDGNYQAQIESNKDVVTNRRPDNEYRTENKPDTDYKTTFESENEYKIRDRLDNDNRNKANINYRANDRLNNNYDDEYRHDYHYINTDKSNTNSRTNTRFKVDYHNRNKFDYLYSSEIKLDNNDEINNKNNNDFLFNKTLDNKYYDKDKTHFNSETDYRPDEKIQNKSTINSNQTVKPDDIYIPENRLNNKYPTKNRLDNEYQSTDKTISTVKFITRPDDDFENKNKSDDYEIHKRLDKQTTKQDYYPSSARSNDEDDPTVDLPEPTTAKLKDENHDKYITTTDNYKLVTFRYVGTYKGNDMTKHDDVTDNTNKDNSKLSKDFSTYRPKTDDLEGINKSISYKLSTFFHYETATRPYNPHRPTRRDDSDSPVPDNTGANIKYYYNENVLHRYPDTNSAELDKISEGNSYEDAQGRFSLDKLSIVEEIESAKAAPVKRPMINAPKTPSVAFQVIPSENSPSQWAVYEESEIAETPYRAMPPAPNDPHELNELPRPMNLSNVRRKKPFRP